MIRIILSWAIAIPLAAWLLFAAAEKLTDAESARAVFETLNARTGITIFDPMMRFYVGVIEGLGALLLLFPASRRFAATVLMALLVVVVGVHFSPFLGTEVPLTLEWDAGSDAQARLLASLIGLMAVMLLLLVHPKWSVASVRDDADAGTEAPRADTFPPPG
jgi:uncharacterized membrane protein YphA (DoxX/SURF4 family)